MRYLLITMLSIGIQTSVEAQTELFETCQYFKTRSVSPEEQLHILGTPQIVKRRPNLIANGIGGNSFFAYPAPIAFYYFQENLIVHNSGWFYDRVTYVLSGQDILRQHGPAKAVKSLPDCVYTKRMAYLKGKGMRTTEKEAVLYIEENGHYSLAFKKNVWGRFKAVAIII